MELIILIVLLLNFGWLLTRADRILTKLDSIERELNAKGKEK